MKYDFDRKIDRYNTSSVKYSPIELGKPEDVLPMWVADMDFPAPPCVLDALRERVSHGIFGYSMPDAAYYETVQDWFSRRFDWRVGREWFITTQGVVNAIFVAVNALTRPGDGIVIQQPVYHPFADAVEKTKRTLLVNKLIYNDNYYSIDFDDFENQIKKAKLFILCNPHNPVGRVWTRDELLRMGEICLRHGVTVIADEIHQDFIYAGHRHHVFAALDPSFADMTVTCTSPSKTFNIAGLSHANIFISNELLRDRFKQENSRCGLGMAGIMGMTACKAAYGHGAEWLAELIDHLAGNFAFMDDFLKARVPKIRLVQPEGTYLAWLDCSRLGLSAKELDEQMVHKAKLWLNDGAMFGTGGAGFQRVNMACPRDTLRDALARLEGVWGEV